MTKIIGITGGIASGKSTVTAYLRQKGYAVLDADALVHELQEPGGCLYTLLLEVFGQEILTANGRLDRQKFAQRIFSNEAERQVLSQVQDAVIRQELLLRRDRLAQGHQLVFLDIPLLFELGYEETVDEIWLVSVDEATQQERLMARNQLTAREAQQRLEAQLPLSEKIGKADQVLDNGGEMEALYQQLDCLLAKMSS